MNTCPCGMIYIEMKSDKHAITDYLSKEFMRKHTNFNSFKELTFSSLVWIDWSKDVVITSESLLNRFISTSTVFNTWNEMISVAIADFEGREERRQGDT